jgi:cytochrome oxidase Cu insertion factor (SCO1/SenC/PrrC family)
MISLHEIYRVYFRSLILVMVISLLACDSTMEKQMSKVALNTPAPNFTLDDFQNNAVNLADFKGKKNVVLIFNRGFS